MEALPVVERICGACTVANTWSFCQAVEKITGVKVPRRAELIRTLLLEIERITNHVGDLGNIPVVLVLLRLLVWGSGRKRV